MSFNLSTANSQRSLDNNSVNFNSETASTREQTLDPSRAQQIDPKIQDFQDRFDEIKKDLLDGDPANDQKAFDALDDLQSDVEDYKDEQREKCLEKLKEKFEEDPIGFIQDIVQGAKQELMNQITGRSGGDSPFGGGDNPLNIRQSAKPPQQEENPLDLIKQLVSLSQDPGGEE